MGRLEKIAVVTILFLITVILAISLRVEDPGDGTTPAADDLEQEREHGVHRAEIPPYVDELRSPLVDARIQRPRDLPPTTSAALDERAADGARIVAPAPGQRSAAPSLASASERPADGESTTRRSALGGREQDSEAQRTSAPGPAAVDSQTLARVEMPHEKRGILSMNVRDEAASERTAQTGMPDGSVLVTDAGLERTAGDEFLVYTWREGDTFTSVVRHYYGDLSLVRLLRTANEDVTDRDLQPGDRILIPAFDRSRSVASDRYTVLGGDTLSSIARKVYGDASVYMRIFEANRDLLSNPDSVAEGQILRIPR